MIRAIVSIIVMQGMVALCVGMIFLMFSGSVAAKSAFIGGAIGFLPSVLYALRVIRSRHGTPERLLRAHYAGEFGKLALTAILFGATFAWIKELSVLPLFAAYTATLLVYWAALLMFTKI